MKLFAGCRDTLECKWSLGWGGATSKIWKYVGAAVLTVYQTYNARSVNSVNIQYKNGR